MNTVTPPLAFHSLDNPDFAKSFPDIAAKYKLPNNDYNPDQAKKLLDAAGWVDSNGDGVTRQRWCRAELRVRHHDKAPASRSSHWFPPT